nr:hypothetical protein [Halomicroarcula pellucida]
MRLLTGLSTPTSGGARISDTSVDNRRALRAGRAIAGR